MYIIWYIFKYNINTIYLFLFRLVNKNNNILSKSVELNNIFILYTNNVGKENIFNNYDNERKYLS